MQTHLWAIGAGSASPFGTIALLAGGVLGALLRLIAERLIPPGSAASLWALELAVAAAFGALLGIPFGLSLHGAAWAGTGLGGAMTAYAGASAFFGYLHARSARINPLGPALAHFLATTTATTVGFVLVVAIWRAAAG